MSLHRNVLLSVISASLLLGITAIEPKDESLAITSSYWDCCKPSCAANGQAQVNTPVGNCDQDNRPLNNPTAVSSCHKGTGGNVRGPSFMCASQAPFVDNSGQAYAFAAVNLDIMPAAGSCCACFQLNFTDGPAQGKSVTIQIINEMPKTINSTFALAIPGADVHGIGPKDGCVWQYGILGEKGWYTDGVANRSDCNSLPPAIAQGCGWGFDWVGMGRSTALWSLMECPAALTDISGCIRYEPATFNYEIEQTGWDALSRKSHVAIETMAPIGFLLLPLGFVWIFKKRRLRQKLRTSPSETSAQYEPGITKITQSYYYKLDDSPKEQNKLGGPSPSSTPIPWVDRKGRPLISERHPATSISPKSELWSPTRSEDRSELKGSPATPRNQELEGSSGTGELSGDAMRHSIVEIALERERHGE